MRTSRVMRWIPKASSGSHPEFGYLCPTGRARVGLRLVATVGTAALAFGAAVLLFDLADRTADASDHALAAAMRDVPPERSTAGSLAELQSDWTAFASRIRHPPQQACNDFAHAFLNASCRSTAARKHRANHRPATVLIGDADESAAAPEVGGSLASSPAPGASTIPLPIARPAVAIARPPLAQNRGSKPTRLDVAPGTVAANEDAMAGGSARAAPAALPFGGLLGFR